jgi:hypothetical protein
VGVFFFFVLLIALVALFHFTFFTAFALALFAFSWWRFRSWAAAGSEHHEHGEWQDFLEHGFLIFFMGYGGGFPPSL